MIHYIDEVEDLKGKRVLVRLDLNVPIVDGQVVDKFRLEKIIDTVDYLRSKDAKVIIIAHCEGKGTLGGTPEAPQESTTLLPMWKYLNGYFPVEFCTTYFTPEAIDKLLNLPDKGVLLFENLRINPGEKENDPEFAKKLSQMADIFVNDAFSVSHRKHASVVGVPAFIPHYGGPLLREEIKNISKAFNPERPFVFVLGGAKFDTKLPLIKKYLDKADTVVVTGALAHNVYKEMGYELGTSLVSHGEFGISDMLKTGKLEVPEDVTVKNALGEISFKRVSEIEKDEYIGDAGPLFIEKMKTLLHGASTIVWNGPLGNYEEGFKDKTEALAEIIAESKAESIVGGGDTLAAIESLGINDKFTFLSTGGGAMLDFLVNETLPGIEALEK